VTQKTNLGGRSSVQPSSELFFNPDVYVKEETQRDKVRAFFKNNRICTECLKKRSKDRLTRCKSCNESHNRRD
jgi:hypothetical protein